jgi:nucleoid DNA-binding protein
MVKAKKAAPKKAVKKATTAKMSAPKKANKPSIKVGKAPFKKSEIYTYVGEATDLSRKQVAGVFESFNLLIGEHLKKTGPGEFIFPGLIKCKIQRKPATKARKGVNPFTGEEIMIKAKPARNVVKVRPLKKLKEMVD